MAHATCRGHLKISRDEREETVTLEEERSIISMTIVTGEIDVGVENETKIGGSMLGVELADTLKESFNYKDTEEYNTGQPDKDGNEHDDVYEDRLRLPGWEGHADQYRVKRDQLPHAETLEGRLDQFRSRVAPSSRSRLGAEGELAPGRP